ncbi:MAG: DNA internalization-related competence protein ComEC/Rec2 [Chloroflexi bacterium]|nr:DNA internalization-related competence protein ComEC/Rec2 [Chloroflexota bacterium]
MTLLHLSLAWLIGIWIGSRLCLPPQYLAAIAVFVLLVTVFLRRHTRLQLSSLCALTLLLGALRYSTAVPHFGPGDLATYNDVGRVSLRGVVCAYPDLRDRYTNLRVSASRLKINDMWLDVRGHALVRASRFLAVRYGDEVEVFGTLETPPVFADFSYQDYLAHQGIHSLVQYAQVSVIGHDKGNPLVAAIYRLRDRARETIALMLPEPEASLLSGILLGLDKGIPKSVADAFRATGTSHIIAISGFNLTIIAGFLALATRNTIGQRYVPHISVMGIALYTFLVGADPPVLRAAIMAILVAIAAYTGRWTEALTSLAVAAFLMTLWNPYNLWDVGFQLSFAATIGILIFHSPLQSAMLRVLDRFPIKGWLKALGRFFDEAIVVTFAAQITTWPIIVHNFHNFSVVSPLTNALILPVQSILMIWGGAATPLGMIFLPAGQILAWVAWLFLTYTTHIVGWFARVPGAAIEGVEIPPAFLAGYYAFLIIIALHDKVNLPTLRVFLTRNFRLRMLFTGLAVILILTWLAVFSLPDGKLHVVFLDVGQGDAIFVQTPTGRQMMIDGGPAPSVVLAGLGKRIPFWDRDIDLLVLTHPDEDHLAGLVSILERYKVGAVLDTPLPHQSPSSARWQELLAKEQTQVVMAERGMTIDLGDGVTAEVLNPQRPIITGTSSDENNNSVVLRLTYGQTTFLFSADVEQEAERRLLTDADALSALILKVSHHGAATATSEAFLQAVHPEVAVISVGAENTFGHPSPETLQRLREQVSEILRTDERGTVEIISDGKQYRVRTEK